MNREVKFRGKSINTNEWIYSMTISKGTIKRKSANWYLEIDEHKWKGVHAKSVGEYSGIKDKLGSPIFEGDILGLPGTDDESICVIIFKEGCFCKKFKGENGEEFNTPWDFSDKDFWTIVGNIFDNPELLK